ncbi:hypothetical protein POM88_041798 [Heracleum sosnowskyi]|uniref:Formate--tetrahydrofolate ligase n=1 Tax=Heracleum sosnowskyi TaxID=360622 RepID=A0AAD8HHI2_9APIA|nr:hypothetical protein POM88_041798 [Heracleum sosnowskyi]
MPGKARNLADVVLGFDSLEPYLNGDAPYFGCIVGRVANMIKDGKFTLDGVDYSLSVNKPPNSLHARHISNTKAYGVNVVVAVNMFSTHTEAEINAVRSASLAAEAFDAVLCTHHAHGGKGTVSTMLLLFQS